MGLRQHAKGTNGSGERWKGNGVSGLVHEENKGAAELEPATHSRKRDMNSEMCRSNVSVLEVRIAAKGVHVRSNAAMVGRQRREMVFCRSRARKNSRSSDLTKRDEPFR